MARRARLRAGGDGRRWWRSSTLACLAPPRRHLAVGACLGVGLGSAATYYALVRWRAGGGVSDAGELGAHPALKYGMPVTSRLRAFSRYVALWDPRTRNPAWVLEWVSRETLNQREGSRGNSAFYEDPGTPPRFRAKLADFKARAVLSVLHGSGSKKHHFITHTGVQGSSYDRGHMAPAANHKQARWWRARVRARLAN